MKDVDTKISENSCRVEHYTIIPQEVESLTNRRILHHAS